MLEPERLEQEDHIGKWRRVASGEEHAGLAVYTSSGTTSSGTAYSQIISYLGMHWLAT